MGVVLEVSKLVAAGWVHSNWKNPLVSKFHRFYLCAAVIALMLITSLGIYGYLMKAHLDQKAPAAEITMQVESHQAQLDQLLAQRTELERQQANINKTVDTYLAGGSARGATTFMSQQRRDRDRISREIAALNAQITAKNVEMAPLRSQANAATAKLGPLTTMGFKDPTAAVQAVIGTLMFAFDPLAIVLMISGTITLGEWSRSRQPKPVVVEAVQEPVEEDLSETDVIEEDSPEDDFIPEDERPVSYEDVIPLVPAPNERLSAFLQEPSIFEIAAKEALASQDDTVADTPEAEPEIQSTVAEESSVSAKEQVLTILENNPHLLEEIVAAVHESDKSEQEMVDTGWLTAENFQPRDNDPS